MELLAERRDKRRYDGRFAVEVARPDVVEDSPKRQGTKALSFAAHYMKDPTSFRRGAAFDQSPIADGSHLLVFAAWDNYTDARIDEVVQLNKAVRGDLPLIDGYYDNLKGMTSTSKRP